MQGIARKVSRAIEKAEAFPFESRIPPNTRIVFKRAEAAVRMNRAAGKLSASYAMSAAGLVGEEFKRARAGIQRLVQTREGPVSRQDKKILDAKISAEIKKAFGEKPSGKIRLFWKFYEQNKKEIVKATMKMLREEQEKD